jgi:methionyl aminopeptidase
MLYNARRRLQLNEAERTQMRAACRFNAQLMDVVRDFIRPGVSTGQIDELVETYTRDHGHVP